MAIIQKVLATPSLILWVCSLEIDVNKTLLLMLAHTLYPPEQNSARKPKLVRTQESRNIFG